MFDQFYHMLHEDQSTSHETYPTKSTGLNSCNVSEYHSQFILTESVSCNWQFATGHLSLYKVHGFLIKTSDKNQFQTPHTIEIPVVTLFSKIDTVHTILYAQSFVVSGFVLNISCGFPIAKILDRHCSKIMMIIPVPVKKSWRIWMKLTITRLQQKQKGVQRTTEPSAGWYQKMQALAECGHFIQWSASW